METIVVRPIRVGLAVSLASVLLLVSVSTLSVQAEGVSPKTNAHQTQPNLNGSAVITLPNGIASGDTTQTSTVLWARGTALGDMLFEYATDPGFNSLLTATATVTDLLQPVKVKITGLSPATPYFYRVTDSANAWAEGQFRTAVPVGARMGLRFGVSGDWKGELAPYPSIANADERNLEFFVEHGDTIGAGAATSLEEYRLKHNEVYSTYFGLNTWADLRGSTSILATIDDNDVRDNFAGGADPSANPDFSSYSGTFINETQLYSNALQAFQEYNPLRDEFYGATGDPRTANKRKLYRFNTYGSDAAVFLLDTRSFRDEQLPLDLSDPAQVIEFLTRSLTDTSRTMLGAQQLADLKADLQQAQTDGINWKFILVSGAIQNLGIFHAEDRYEGYAAERTDLLRFINQNSIDNVVFIAAGLHGTIVNNLTYQEVPFGPQIPTKAFEVIVGPVAIDPPAGPFGPAIIELAEDYGLITPEERATYEALPREGKDEFIRQLMDDLITPLGYDPIGLAGSGIEADLLQGGYVVAHTYGWTEFEISQGPQVLTVTTYGIDFYTEAELSANPTDIITRTPAIISQFVVTPSQMVTPVEAVTISGPATGTVSTSYTFTATASPISATTPVTYSWQAGDQTTVTHTNDLSDSTTFSWPTTGPKTITVTAQNGGSSPVSNTHNITITSSQAVTPVEAVTINGPVAGAVRTPYTFTATVSPISATTPVTYSWQASHQTGVTHTNNLSDSATFSWISAGPQTITVTARNGSSPVSNSYAIAITAGSAESNSSYLPLILKE